MKETSECIVYRPNQRHWAAIPAGILCILAGLAGVCTAPVLKGILLSGSLLILGTLATFILIQTAGKTVLCSPTKLLIKQGRAQTTVFWEEYPYIYIVLSFRGQEYLLFSKSILGRKEQKNAANRAEFGLSYPNTVTLWNNSTVKAQHLFSEIKKHYK